MNNKEMRGSSEIKTEEANINISHRRHPSDNYP